MTILPKSSRPEELPLQVLTEPYVSLSTHTAPHDHPLLRQGFCVLENFLPSLVEFSLPLVMSAPSLHPHYKHFNTTTS